MTDPGGMFSRADRERLRDHEARLAALERLLSPSAGLGPGVSTQYGALSVSPRQVGIPVKITVAWTDADGYTVGELATDTTDAPIGLVAPAPQRTFTKVLTPSGDTSLQPGTVGWLEPAPTAAGYVLIATEPGSVVLRGKLDGTLTFGGSATMSVWAYSGGSVVDTGVNVTVVDWHLSSGQTIASGTQVTAAYAGGQWVVIAAQC